MNQTDNYRWIVRVKGDYLARSDYVREVTTNGPKPDEAIKIALGRITDGGDDDLWQNNLITVTVERVR